MLNNYWCLREHRYLDNLEVNIGKYSVLKIHHVWFICECVIVCASVSRPREKEKIYMFYS